MPFIFVFIFGLLVASFINCLVYRLHTKQSFVSGRSFCPHCRALIHWYDNIPLLSYFLLRGRCRACRQKISLSYPLIELTGGISFLLVFLILWPDFSFLPIWPLALTLIRNWLFAAILIALFLYDLKYYLVPDIIALPAALLALIFNLFIYWSKFPIFSFWPAIGQYLLAGLVAGGFFLFLFLVSRGRWIGGGDIRLGFLIGFLVGWPFVLVALFISYVSGALIGLLLIAFKRKTMQSVVPFGAFLAPATFITLLFGQQLLDFYLSWPLLLL
ncbi:MAG TPA: prepilin peptidase [bacterium]|nr:prepilin peptidase [bacterium]